MSLLSTATARAYDRCAVRHPCAHAPKRRKARKPRGFRANDAHGRCVKDWNLLDSTPIIRGINGTELVDLTLKYYEDLSDRYRKMIPLKMVYIPVPRDEE